MALPFPAHFAPFVDPQTGRLTVAGKALLDALQRQGEGDDTLEGQDGAFYLARENHTGTQSQSTVDGLEVALDGKVDVLADPGADRIRFWDDSAGAEQWLAIGTYLEITGTTLNATVQPQDYSRIDAVGDIRIDADGNLRISA